MADPGPTIGLVLDSQDPAALAAFWAAALDPEGNEFCVCDGGAGHETA